MKSLPFYIPEAWKMYLLGGASQYRPLKGVPHPPPHPPGTRALHVNIHHRLTRVLFWIAFCLCVKMSFHAKPFIMFLPTVTFSRKWNSFSCERFCMRTLFKTESQDNSKVGYMTNKLHVIWLNSGNDTVTVLKNMTKHMQQPVCELSGRSW